MFTVIYTNTKTHRTYKRIYETIEQAKGAIWDAQVSSDYVVGHIVAGA